jgi:hypothetical protein
LHLAHQRKHFALAAIHRQPGINPRLRAALDEDAAVEPGALKFLDGFARPPAGLAQDVNWFTRRPEFTAKGGGVKFVKRDEFRAGNMGGGKFTGRADIQQFGSGAAGEPVVKLARGDGSFWLNGCINYRIII